MQVNLKYNFLDPISEAHTQNIERLWRLTREQDKQHLEIHRSMFPT